MTNIADAEYLALLDKVLWQGIESDDRTGTGTLSIFGTQMRFNISERFPLLTTKKVHWPSILHELLWFISGNTNTKYLVDNKVKIWNEWATEGGELGPLYGEQWRKFGSAKCREHTAKVVQVDQLQQVINQIQENPNSRRHLVSAWNPGLLPDESLSPQENVKNGNMALAPCHTLYQFYVRNGKLSCQLYQRSADLFLGVPFNIASYSALTYMIARLTGLTPGEFIWVGGDTHIYNNHIEQVKEQLARPIDKDSPELWISPIHKEYIDDFIFDDFAIVGYDPHPPIKASISV